MGGRRREGLPGLCRQPAQPATPPSPDHPLESLPRPPPSAEHPAREPFGQRAARRAMRLRSRCRSRIVVPIHTTGAGSACQTSARRRLSTAAGLGCDGESLARSRGGRGRGTYVLLLCLLPKLAEGVHEGDAAQLKVLVHAERVVAGLAQLLAPALHPSGCPCTRPAASHYPYLSVSSYRSRRLAPSSTEGRRITGSERT